MPEASTYETGGNTMSSDEQDDKECPLCMEPFELDDINFYPCECKYQICRFCWHRIRMDENGLCPACRAKYPELPVNFTPLSHEELAKIRSDKRHKQQKEKQKLSESRKHLANIRVLQKNLVYVVGLSTRVADAETLKKPEYFGKYGKIHKVVVVSTAAGATTQSCPKGSSTAYVTYSRCEDALKAIQSVNNCQLDGRAVRVSLGTTKYCSSFLRNQTCQKTECMYLHDVADEDASFTKDDMQQGKHTEYERKLLEHMFTNHILPNNHKRSLNGSAVVTTTSADDIGGGGGVRRSHRSNRSTATSGSGGGTAGGSDRQSQYEAPPRHQRGRQQKKNAHSSADARGGGGAGTKTTTAEEQQRRTRRRNDDEDVDDAPSSSGGGSQSPMALLVSTTNHHQGQQSPVTAASTNHQHGQPSPLETSTKPAADNDGGVAEHLRLVHSYASLEQHGLQHQHLHHHSHQNNHASLFASATDISMASWSQGGPQETQQQQMVQPPPMLQRVFSGSANGLDTQTNADGALSHMEASLQNDKRRSPRPSATTVPVAVSKTSTNGGGEMAATDWQAAFGLEPTSCLTLLDDDDTNAAVATPPPTAPSPMTDDDLGFDPFSESSKGLADLLEEEREQQKERERQREHLTHHRHQSSSSLHTAGPPPPFVHRQHSSNSGGRTSHNSGSGSAYYGASSSMMGGGWNGEKRCDGTPTQQLDGCSPSSMLPPFTTPPPALPPPSSQSAANQQYNDFLHHKSYQSSPSGGGFPFHHGVSPEYTDFRGGGGAAGMPNGVVNTSGAGGFSHLHHQHHPRHSIYQPQHDPPHHQHQSQHGASLRYGAPPPSVTAQSSTAVPPRSLSPLHRHALMFPPPPPSSLHSGVDGAASGASPLDLREWQEGLKALLPNVNISFANDLQPPPTTTEQHNAPPPGVANHISMMTHGSAGAGGGWSSMPMPPPGFTRPPPPLTVATTNLGGSTAMARPSPPDLFGARNHPPPHPPPFAQGGGGANPWSSGSTPITPPPGFSPGGGGHKR